MKKWYTGDQCIFVLARNRVSNILARHFVPASYSKKMICRYNMKNNIPATTVFWYRHGTGFQAYRHEILYRQADQQIFICRYKMKNNIPAIELFLYRHGTGFQAYRHDFLYRQADQKFALAVTKWNNNILATSLFMYWHCTQPMKHTGKTCCTGMPIPSRMCATWCSRSGSCHGMAGTGMVARESASVPWQGSVAQGTL